MKIHLSKDTTLDLDKMIESRAIFQANSGGGKSWAGRRFIEQTFGHKQLIIIDPEGEFGNLREAFDFVYIAKDGGDAPAEVRSAALLARRLLETKANAIIDIYELGSQRGDFVKAFFDATVNMPKNLWQDCFYLLDEAHKFAPEKGQGESVALQSVIDMASLGRKRGYCLIPMTQRPAKLSKDVVAECNNKLIGRASLDIDRERSAKELGFRTKEDILSLRDLEPGEFYVFGPAISRTVKKTHIGDVKIKPPKRGSARRTRIAPPTAKVKKILAELADLPQAAQKEATTTKELQEALRIAQGRIRTLERDNKPTVQQIADPKAIETAIRARDAQWKALLLQWREIGYGLGNALEKAQKLLEAVPDYEWPDMEPEKAVVSRETSVVHKAHLPQIKVTNQAKEAGVPIQFPMPIEVENISIGKGEREVLNAIAQDPEGITTEHLAILTGYKQTSRRVYTNNLIRAGLIEKNDEIFTVTQAGIDTLGPAFRQLPQGRELRDYFLSTLPEGERKIFSMIAIAGGTPVSREDILIGTGYKQTSVRVYLNKLAARKAVKLNGFYVELADNLK